MNYSSKVDLKGGIVFLLSFLMISDPALRLVLGGDNKIVSVIGFVVFCITVFRRHAKFTSLDIVFSLISIFFCFLLGVLIYFHSQHVTDIIYLLVMLMFFFLGYVYTYNASRAAVLLSVVFSVVCMLLYMRQFDISVGSLGRFAAPGFDINYIAFCVNLLFLHVAFLSQHTKKYKIFYTILLLSLLFGILLTGSRAAIIVGFCSLPMVLVSQSGLRKGIYVFIIVVICLVFSIEYSELVDTLINRFFKNTDRENIWGYAITMLEQSNNWTLMFGRDPELFLREVGKVTHNDLLTLLISKGVLFTLIYYAVFLVAIFISLKKYLVGKNQYIRTYYLFLFLVLFTFIFRGIFSNFFPIMSLFFYLGATFSDKKRNNRSVGNLKEEG